MQSEKVGNFDENGSLNETLKEGELVKIGENDGLLGVKVYVWLVVAAVVEEVLFELLVVVVDVDFWLEVLLVTGHGFHRLSGAAPGAAEARAASPATAARL